MCLECEPGLALSLDSYKCLETCPQDRALIEFDGLKFCRANEYFIDGQSEAPYEFGTFEFPFKRLVFAAKELFNIRI